MKKSMVLVLISLMIISVFMISCNSDISDNSSGGDKLVKVVFSTENTGSKGISATPVEADSPKTLYWYYKASKADSSLYRTGETVALGSDGNNGAGGWKAVNPDGNGNAQSGFDTLNDATYQSLNYFSEGAWVFSFRAYSVAVDWDTTNKDQAYITDNSQTTNLDPVYYQDNLSASITSTTIADDGKYHITISPTAGDLGNAVLVFPTTTTDLLNWKYIDDGNGASEATITALSGHSAVMKVFYTTDTAITGDTQWTALAISTNDNAISNGVVAFDDFVSWNGTTTNNEEDITLESSVAGIDYKLKFEVWSTNLADENVKLGSFTLESATAYLGGKIELAIASGSSYAVTDNESQIEVVITDINPVVVVVQATTASATDTSATATIVAPAAPEVALTSDEAEKTKKTVSPALKIESEVSAVSDGGANTGVSIPEGGLADTTTTATYVDNGLTTTVTTSSTHNITIDVKDETNEEVTGASFEITVANNETVTSDDVVTLAGIDFTLTKTTTRTTTTYDSNGVVTSSFANTTETNATVTDFNEKYTTVYATIKPNQTGVQVLYSGGGAQPVFNSSNTNPSIAAAEADTSDSNVGTGYNPTTGLIVFKTNHFSQFYVTSTPVAEVIHGETHTKYGSLEEAVSAAEDGDTIKLLDNITYGKDKEVDVWEKAFNLDLNNKTFTTNSNQSISLSNNGYKASAVCFAYDGEHEITVSNGTINTAYGAGIYDASKNVTISNVVIHQNYPDNVQATDEYSSAIRLSSGAIVVISSGEFYGKHAVAVSNSGGTVTINGGTFNSNLFFNTAGTKADKVINITGGTFNNFAVENGDKGTLTITGGTFSSDPSAYVAEGYEVVKDSELEGYFKVQEQPVQEQPVVSVVKNNETTNYYASSYTTVAAEHNLSADLYALNAAMAAVSASENGGETIVLGKDVNLSGVPGSNESGLTNIGGSEQLIYEGPSATIDFNGHTLNGTIMSGSVLSYYTNQTPSSHLILTDSGSNDSFSIDSNAHVDGASYQKDSLWAMQSYITVNGGSYIQRGAGNVLTCQIQDKVDDHYGLIINDGRFEVTAYGGCVVSDVIGDIDINGGTFINSGSIAPAVFAISRGDSDVSNKVTIDGGSFEGWLLFDLYDDGDGSEIIINDGTFTLNSFNFNDTDIAPRIAGKNDNSTGCYSIIINGGTFNLDPRESDNYGDGYNSLFSVTINGIVTEEIIDNVTWYTVEPNN